MEKILDHRLDVQTVGLQLQRIINDVADKDERFVVDRLGKPAVVIMSVKDFIRTLAPAPNWLEDIWQDSRERGLDRITPAEVDAEIEAYRRGEP